MIAIQPAALIAAIVTNPKTRSHGLDCSTLSSSARTEMISRKLGLPAIASKAPGCETCHCVPIQTWMWGRGDGYAAGCNLFVKTT